MKKNLLFLFALGCISSINAQTIVSTTPQNKKVILEEFTGTGCPNCPGGHTMAASILSSNPGNAFVIANHPTGSSYTTNDPMKHTFPAAFYSNPFISPSSRYMPSATVNRRVWDANGRISGVNDWTSRTNTIKNESAPVNLGVLANYNTNSKNLTVTVEVYFTSNVTDNTTINVYLTEDGIIASQSGSGGGSNYTHNHVFRESMTAQWGDAISAPTTSGSLKTLTFTFNNSTKNYNMNNCEVVAFVRNAANEEILNGNGANVNSSTNIALSTVSDKASIYPNPITQETALHMTLSNSQNVDYVITNILGQEVYSENLGTLSSGVHTINIGNKAILPSGVYFINIKLDNEIITHKLIVE